MADAQLVSAPGARAVARTALIPSYTRVNGVLDQIESQIGRVTARIAPGLMGEVRIPYRGGTETFHARAWDESATFEVGDEVVVIERVGPRTVRVALLAEEES